MLNIAWYTLRSRLSAFTGTFIALMLGAALLSTMGLVLAASVTSHEHGPGRFAKAPVIVRGEPDLSMSDPWGGIESEPLKEPKGLAPALVRDVSAVGKAVADRTFYAQLGGSGTARSGPSDQVGHPWSSAAFGGYRLLRGQAPAGAGEVAVPAKSGAAPGERVTVLTASGPRPFTVSGVTDDVSFESALFFSDAEAAALSPRVDALVSYGDVDKVRTAVEDRAQVLAGADRVQADPRAHADEVALVGVSTMLGMATGVAAFVAAFVVGTTFAFSVAQRRRELAVLRATGATPVQVGKLVLAEAALVGAVASAAGCLLGLAGGPALAGRMSAWGLAPEWFRVRLGWSTLLVLVLAFLIGVLLAVLGSGVAVVRAGRIRPLEALRESAVERRAMNALRWLAGIAALAVGGVLLLATPLLPPAYWGDITPMAAPALIVAGALLCPVVIPFVVRVVTAPFAALRGAGPMLVQANTVTALRRTAATVAPVLITVGLFSALWSTSGTLSGVARSEAYERVRGNDFVVAPDHTPGLSRAVVDKVRAVPGIETATTVPTGVYTIPGPNLLVFPAGAPLLPYDALTVAPKALGGLLTLPVVHGDARGLDDRSIIVDETWNRHVGDTVTVWLADGTEKRLKVVAVTKASAGGSAAVLTPKYAGRALPDAVYVKLAKGADRAAVQRELGTAVRGMSARAVPIAGYRAAVDDTVNQQTRMALLIVGGIAMLYTGVAVANTLTMSTGQRARELAVLRLGGATPGQLLRMVAGESVLVAGTGVVMAAVVVALNAAGLWAGLQQLVVSTRVTLPGLPFAVTAGACVVVALLATVLPAWVALRTPAVRLTTTE
ncbi:FtsX-like permease family protein [Streptomyces sp. SCPE 10]|uniref:FtsX-like permease family protein n=1 Tax=Streptomyces sp. SCPE 10 TaxID=3449273 RepID=UPI003F7F3E20